MIKLIEFAALVWGGSAMVVDPQVARLIELALWGALGLMGGTLLRRLGG